MTRVSRRRFFECACGMGAAIAAVPATGPAAWARGPTTTLTADQALTLLKEGNDRFVADKATPIQTGRDRRLNIAKGQTPFAVLVACSDSRVPPELLFGRGLGELFIVRVAGNTVDTAGLGSIQYAVAELGVPLVLVLGHQRCGAAAAAAAAVTEGANFPGSIGQLIEPIIPAVLTAQKQPGDLVENAVKENVRRVVQRLRTASEPMLMDPLRTGKLKIVGARYSLDDGDVDFFDEG